MEIPKLAQILIVEDDASYREIIADYLKNFNYAVAEAGGGIEMDAWMQNNKADLVILDLMLPGEDGLSLAKRLRAENKRLPIMMISACGEDADRIVGLEMGADMYLAKPLRPRALLAHVRAILRQYAANGEEQSPGGNNLNSRAYNFGPFELDTLTRRLSRHGTEITLTGAEYELLMTFVMHPDEILTRDRLTMLLRGYEPAPYERSVDVRVSRLRSKIEPDPANPSYINTVRGEGYIFSPGT